MTASPGKGDSLTLHLEDFPGYTTITNTKGHTRANASLGKGDTATNKKV